MRKKIENALFELVITPDLRGFDYICRGVEIIASSKEKVDMVKGLYIDIAKEFNTTQAGVERAIRHAFAKVDKESEAFAHSFTSTVEYIAIRRAEMQAKYEERKKRIEDMFEKRVRKCL